MAPNQAILDASVSIDALVQLLLNRRRNEDTKLPRVISVAYQKPTNNNLEFIWIIGSPILKQLKSLTIFVSDIKRYLGAVDRLRRLRHVDFSLGELLDYNPRDIDNSPTSMDIMATNKARKEEAMQDMIRFVKEHRQHFKSQLKTARCLDSFTWPGAVQTCSDAVHMEMFQYLPALSLPTTINFTNLMQFIAQLSTTNLEYVQHIDTTRDNELAYWQLCDNRHFLQRCRAPMHLTMRTLGQSTFSWAVQEKKDLEIIDSGNSSNNNNNSIRDLSALLDEQENRQLFLRHGLVPLRALNIIESVTNHFTDEIGNAAIAFSQTLTTLQIWIEHSALVASTHSTPTRAINVGRGWVDLFSLTDLNLASGDARIVIDQELLTRCPNLVNCVIQDVTLDYHLQDVVPCQPATHLSHLKMSNLIGWSALCFHPDTLYSTPSLTKLSLQTKFGQLGICFDAPEDNNGND
ncbi:hypothetical protein BGW39_005753 [Mortierella sp. 14UC]|nr:hypothetical protein BGW39_005753 [Mortierella sp. 14UC]